eukprot:9946948-Alexandrium_andersonii.AAC.1
MGLRARYPGPSFLPPNWAGPRDFPRNRLCSRPAFRSFPPDPHARRGGAAPSRSGGARGPTTPAAQAPPRGAIGRAR